jgi:hypothetical protein
MVKTGWFAFADLCMAVATIILLILAPRLNWLPLILAALPWLIRICLGGFPFRRTKFDLLILFFALGAAVGVWAAYNPVDAWRKFWLLCGGIFLFYALAGQPEENHKWLTGFAILTGGGTALFFIMTNDWQVQPAKIALINQAGLWWMHARPSFLGGQVHPAEFADITGGVIAFTTPFLLAFGWKAWQAKNWRSILCFVIFGGLTGAGFLLAISRAAVVALSAGLAAWIGLGAIERMRPFVRSTHLLKLMLGFCCAALLVLGGVFLLCGGPLGLLRTLLKIYSASGRLDLVLGTIKLIGDFPITGGGLSSFPGLYSTYILEVPYFFISNSHNLFLDVGLEQGIIGMIAFLLVYLGCLRLLFARVEKSRKILFQAVFSSLIVTLVHGLVDDIIYGSNSAYLVFLIPGIACALAWPGADTKPLHRQNSWAFRSKVVAASGLVIVLLLANWNVLLSSWYANLGAVELARIDLVHFPNPPQDSDGPGGDLSTSITLFHRALEFNPNQRTADHRLGRIAYNAYDFQHAVAYLDVAYQVDSDHRGIIKDLAYSYIWTGQFDQALSLLEKIPEARQDLGIYAWWWQTQGRYDYSANSTFVLNQLDH